MDSLTQIVLGGTVAALAAPARHRRAALITGAALGTLPDLDVLWFGLAQSDAVTAVTWHRGPSHSLPVLALLGWLLWLVLRRYTVLVGSAPRPWLYAIWLALLTHPLLDAFTVYGTQLLWPLQTPPVMWSTVFVIDPLYTLPLLAGMVAAWRLARREQPLAAIQAASNGWRTPTPARNWLLAGLLASSLYLAWSVAAKIQVERIAARSLAPLGLQDAPRFSTPAPLNTLLWRVIVMAPGGYYIGDRSLAADEADMSFAFHASETQALAEVAAASPGLRRLLWFTHGFVNAREQRQDGQARLIVSDLRMGLEPDYNFRYDVAGLDAQGRWQPAATITRVGGLDGRSVMLGWIWRRIWDARAQP